MLLCSTIVQVSRLPQWRRWLVCGLFLTGVAASQAQDKELAGYVAELETKASKVAVPKSFTHKGEKLPILSGEYRGFLRLQLDGKETWRPIGYYFHTDTESNRVAILRDDPKEPEHWFTEKLSFATLKKHTLFVGGFRLMPYLSQEHPKASFLTDSYLLPLGIQTDIAREGRAIGDKSPQWRAFSYRDEEGSIQSGNFQIQLAKVSEDTPKRFYDNIKRVEARIIAKAKEQNQKAATTAQQDAEAHQPIAEYAAQVKEQLAELHKVFKERNEAEPPVRDILIGFDGHLEEAYERHLKRYQQYESTSQNIQRTQKRMDERILLRDNPNHPKFDLGYRKPHTQKDFDSFNKTIDSQKEDIEKHRAQLAEHTAILKASRKEIASFENGREKSQQWNEQAAKLTKPSTLTSGQTTASNTRLSEPRELPTMQGTYQGLIYETIRPREDLSAKVFAIRSVKWEFFTDTERNLVYYRRLEDDDTKARFGIDEDNPPPIYLARMAWNGHNERPALLTLNLHNFHQLKGLYLGTDDRQSVDLYGDGKCFREDFLTKTHYYDEETKKWMVSKFRLEAVRVSGDVSEDFLQSVQKVINEQKKLTQQRAENADETFLIGAAVLGLTVYGAGKGIKHVWKKLVTQPRQEAQSRQRREMELFIEQEVTRQLQTMQVQANTVYEEMSIEERQEAVEFMMELSQQSR